MFPVHIHAHPQHRVRISCTFDIFCIPSYTLAREAFQDTSLAVPHTCGPDVQVRICEEADNASLLPCKGDRRDACRLHGISREGTHRLEPPLLDAMALESISLEATALGRDALSSSLALDR